jgi:photosystem II stability/assembly factor-like uncharacterized protein
MKKSLLWICLITFILLASAQELSAKDWEYQKSGTTSNLTAVSFVDHEYGWAVGENGAILATLDGGLNWIVMNASVLDQAFSAFPYPQTCHFRSVCFLNRENGWVAGEITLSGVEAEDTLPFPVQFGVILHTRDGGQSWECQYPWNMWTPVEPEAWPRIKQINDVFFLNRQEGWAVGNDFYYLATKNGGQTWEERPIGIWVIPEIRQNLTATQWISSQWGWVAGYQYNMNSPETRNGFIAHTKDRGETWEIDDLLPVSSAAPPALTDLELKASRANTDNVLPAWAVGEQGTILHLVSEGWEHQGFPWPFSLPLPQFNAAGFVDDSHGWLVGYRFSNNSYEDSDPNIPTLMTLFQTANGGENWKHFPWNDPGKLNDVDLAGGTDAWAVGDEGVILHYQNHAPEICRAWAEPQTVYAGQAVDLYVSVKDLDGPSDIEKVTVDARPIGGGMVVLERTWLEPDDRRCVLFQGEADISPLASYGSHRLPAEAVDYDGARASEEIDLFVITSWVEIKRTMAIPDPVAVGGKVLLAAEVDIMAPKGQDGDEVVYPDNKVEKVTVDITDLLGVDCLTGTDCIIMVEMTDPDGDGIYTYLVESVTGGPGKYELPVWAMDTLGHEDKARLAVRVVDTAICYFDKEHDGDVDGTDLADFARYFRIVNTDHSFLKAFASEFGRIDCECPVFPRIEEYSNSGCLPGHEIISSEDPYPWCGEDQIEVMAEGNRIHLIHKNATYNCCPDDIEVSLSFEGNLIRLTEKEILTHPCTCLCCYDVESTIVDLPSGSYTLEYCWYDYETQITTCDTDEVVIP